MSDDRLKDYFSGRDAELADAMSVIRSPGKHLLVIHGPAGIGKQAFVDMIALGLASQASTIVSQSRVPLYTIHDLPIVLRSWRQAMPQKTKMKSFDREVERSATLFEGPLPSQDHTAGHVAASAATKFAGPGVGLGAALVGSGLAGPIGGLGGALAGAALEVSDARRRPQWTPMTDVHDAVRGLTRAFADDLSQVGRDRILLVGAFADPDGDAIEALAAFLKACPDHVAVVLPAVQSWPFRHARWPEDARDIITLDRLAVDDAADLATRYGNVAGLQLSADQRDRIVAISGGLPLMVIYAIDSIRDLGHLPLEAALATTFERFVLQTLGMWSGESKSNLATMTMLRSFDRRRLGEMGIGYSDADWQDLTERRGYIQQLAYGSYAVHDFLRAVFTSYFVATDQASWRERRRQVAERFDAMAARAMTAQDVEEFATEAVYHWLAFDSAGESDRLTERCEFLASHRLPDKLARLVRDVQAQELDGNVAAWLQYYGARADQIGGRRLDVVEAEYRGLLTRDDVQGRLRAYVYCDLAQILARPARLRESGGRVRAENFIAIAADAVEGGPGWGPDPKLAQCWTHAARVHDHACEWEQSVAKLELQEAVAGRHGWMSVSARARVSRAERLALAGLFGESISLDSPSPGVSDPLEALSTGSVLRGLWVYASAGRFRDGATLADEKLAYARLALGEDAVAFYCREAGYLHGLRGDRRASELLFQESESLYRSVALKASYEHGLGMTLGFWAEVGMFSGWDAYCPVRALDEAHSIKLKYEDTAGIPETLALLAHTELAAGNCRDARDLYGQVLRAALVAQRPYFQLTARIGTARTLLAQSAEGSESEVALAAECKTWGFHRLAAMALLIAAQRAEEEDDRAALWMEAIVEALEFNTSLARAALLGDVWDIGDLAIASSAHQRTDIGALSILRQLWGVRSEEVRALERRRLFRNDHVLCADFSLDSAMAAIV